MHPLIGDLTGQTDDELVMKITDLSRRMTQAYRMGYSDAAQQLQMIMGDYMAEQQRRQQKMMEEMLEKSKEFKNIIDVK